MDEDFKEINDATDLTTEGSIVALIGETPFTHCGFTKEDLEKLLAVAGAGGIAFLPFFLKSDKQLTLLAVPVTDLWSTSPLSPAILSFCPPRCKWDKNVQVLTKFPASLKVDTTTV